MKKKFLAALGICAVLTFAMIFFLDTPPDDEKLPLKTPAPSVKKISVYVSGQVNNISVVELEDNGNLHVIDAVNKAGGTTNLADTEAVNLAAPLTDGQHIHIPTKEIFEQDSSTIASTPAGTNTSDKININTADVEELVKLKGIGPALAQRIVEHREQNGAFKTIDEIKNVRGIADKKFAAFKDQITVR